MKRGGLLLLLVVAFIAGLLPGPARALPAPLEGIPRFKHVFTIVLENQNYTDVWGPNGPAYLNSLVPQGAFASEFYGTSHASADNYIAMTSGQTPIPVFMADCLNWSSCYGAEKARLDDGRNITDQIEKNHLSWKGYMDGMSRPCQHPALTQPVDPDQTGYATRHNPFVYYPTIVDDVARCRSHVRRYTELATDIAANQVPNYAFIVPDTCHDGHDAPCANGAPGGLVSADAWLAANVPAILNSAAFQDKGVLFITFDEAATDVTGCCATGVPNIGVNGGGRIGLLALSPLITPGTTTAHPYDQYGYLRTVEDALGISWHINNARNTKVQAMSELF